MNYLITIPSTRGGATLHLYRDDLPTWWSKRAKLFPGADLLGTFTDDEIAGKTLDEIAGRALMAREYGVAR